MLPPNYWTVFLYNLWWFINGVFVALGCTGASKSPQSSGKHPLNKLCFELVSHNHSPFTLLTQINLPQNVDQPATSNLLTGYPNYHAVVDKEKKKWKP